MGEDYVNLHQKLTLELWKQKAIFDELAPKVIEPSNDPGYLEAKKKFDAADKRIKEIEKALAEMEEEREPDYFKFLEKFKKLLKSDDDDEESVAMGVRG
jgi:hypothetical protein